MAISYSEALAKLATITDEAGLRALLNSLTRQETNQPGLPRCGPGHRMRSFCWQVPERVAHGPEQRFFIISQEAALWPL